MVGCPPSTTCCVRMFGSCICRTGASTQVKRICTALRRMRAHPGVRYCGHFLAGLGLLGASKARAPFEAGRAAGMTLLSAMETGLPRPWASG